MNTATDSSTRVHRYAVGAGVEVVADVGGDPAAPAVILLHGGGQTRHSWRGAMRELLRQGYHVINLDARGHGQSGWSADADYQLETLADDLLQVIATLPTKPALVGASMGGATALYAAGKHAQPLAAALVLVDMVPRIDPAGANRVIGFMNSRKEGFANLEEVADAVATYNPHRPRPSNIQGLMKNLRHGDDGRLYWHWDPRIMDNPRRVEPPDLAETLLQAATNVRAPTLLVRGMQSDIVTEDGIAELRERMPEVEVFDVAGAGHMVAGDRNDAFNEGVLSFLRRHHPAR